MKRKRRTGHVAAIAVLIVLVLLGETSISLIGGPGLKPPGDTLDDDAVVDTVERTWEGGGSNLLFVDDMRPGTALHHESSGSVVTQDYYGGALPEVRDGSARWAQELYRWGTHSEVGESSPWHHAGEAWRFGDEVEEGVPGYLGLGGPNAELVTPVVDLRSVPRSPGMQAHWSLPPRDLGCDLVVLPTLCSNLGLEEIMDSGDVLAEQLLPDKEEREIADPVQPAAAALRLRHKYDFFAGSMAGEFRDGGRLEISRLDQGTDTWTPWHGITPTQRSLEIGMERVDARTGLGEVMVNVTVEWDREEHAADTQVYVEQGNVNVTAGPGLQADDDMPVVDGGSGPFVNPGWQSPHLYQGEVGSGGWQGFVGNSQGWVESIFDLSNYAGELVRLRFVAATAETVGGSPVHLGPEGWFVDELSVHASESNSIDVVGLAVPGQGVILEPGSRLEPELVLQNTGTAPVEANVATTINGVAHVERVKLGVGPTARAVVPTGHDINLEAGLYQVETSITILREIDEVAGSAKTAESGESHARFHFLASDGREWEPRQARFIPLVEDDDGDRVEDPSGGRSVARDQPARIRVLIDNLGPSMETIRLSGPDGSDWDVSPRIVDELGQEAGDMVPVSQNPVDLPPSRGVSGTKGSPGTTEAVWEWSGTDRAEVLRFILVIRDDEGNEHVAIEGGQVAVQSTVPPVLSIDYRNPWELSGCARTEVHMGSTGVVRCEPKQSGPSKVVSTARFLQEVDLVRGRQTDIQVEYAGGPFNVMLQSHNVSVPMERPPPGAEWENLIKGLSFEAADNSWKTNITDLLQVPRGFQGFVRLVFEADEPVDFTTVRLLQRVERDDETLRVPLMSQTWETTFDPSEHVILATSRAGAFQLHGRDTAREDANVYSPEDPFELTDVSTKLDKGDVKSDAGGGMEFPTGRLLENSYLELRQPLDLTGVARPELRFNHWMELGPHGKAIVEVARVRLPDVNEGPEGTPEPSTGHLLSSLEVGEWRPLREYRFNSAGGEVREDMASLAEFAGEKIQFRFRYHLESTALTRFYEGIPLGWVIDGIKVTGWDETGSVHLHVAKDGYVGYTSSGGGYMGREIRLPIDNCWQENLESLKHPGDCYLPYGESTVVTNAIDIGLMSTPTLTLRSKGEIRADIRCLVTTENHFAMFDVEYQVRNPDGTWPVGWGRGHPVISSGNRASAMTWNHVDPDEGSILLTPGQAMNGAPFVYIDRKWGCGEGNLENISVWDDAVFQLDLEPLFAEGATAEPIRMRINAWGTCWGNSQATFNQCEDSNGFGDVELFAIEVGENQHAVDAAVESIHIIQDDRPHLETNSPSLAQTVTQDAIVGSDFVDLVVNVSNPGFVPVDVDVGLQGSNDNDPGVPLDVQWIEIRDDGDQIPQREGRPGTLDALMPGEESQLLFRADLTDQPPGNYTFSARVDVTNGLDTNPGNDRAELGVRLFPFRDLQIDLGGSGVVPFATSVDQPRSITTTVVNQGNIVDRASVDAEIVRMTGLTSFEPINPPLPEDLLESKTRSLAHRGNERWGVEWSFDPNVLESVDLSGLRPGEQYAIKVSVSPESGFVKKWWGGEQGEPLEEGSLLHNVTRMPNENCHCALIPFIVEHEIYSTDFSPQNSTSVAPHAFPVDTLDALLDDWEVQLIIDGESVEPEARPDLPHWNVVASNELAEVFGGQATGNAWHLPEYAGLEPLRHELVSPTLPAHIIRSDSRAILSMFYAATDMTEDQVRLETRNRVGGEWGEWRPIDNLRTNRVAIVLAPDFPRVIADGLSDPEFMYSGQFLRTMTDHPTPPFYKNALDQSYIQQDGGDEYDDSEAPICRAPGQAPPTNLCWWSPPPEFSNESSQGEWVEALNATLRNLASSVGIGNIGVFTTISDDLGVGNPNDDGSLFYEFTDDQNIDRRLPIQDLGTLGLRLDTYGAILTMGDNTTSTLADRSSSLIRMSHGPGDWAYKTPTEVATRHHEDLFALLQAAPAAGVRVLGAIGPASAQLAQSGVLPEDTRMAAWQTYPHMPRDSGFEPIDHNNLHCTGNKTSTTGNTYTRPEDIHSGQPLAPCQITVNAGGQPQTNPDTQDPHNYWRISPQDAQSLAMRDFVPGSVRETGRTSLLLDLDDCDRDHPFFSGNFVCHMFAHHVIDQVGNLRVVTAARADGNTTWIDNVLGSLEADGKVPSTQGLWSDLPPALSFPMGGAFWRDDDGVERFDGSPTQIRLIVEADPDVGGHGSMGIDRLQLLGTNRTQGLGLEFVRPIDGGTYHPTNRFTPVIEVTNRGVKPTPNVAGNAFRVEQWTDRSSCSVGEITRAFAIEELSAGEQTQIEIPNLPGGRFPHNPDCDIDASDQRNVFNFTAELSYADSDPRPPFDDDPLDDRTQVTVIGEERINIAVLNVHLRPAQQVASDTDRVTVEATIASESTQSQRIIMDVSLHHARPVPCRLDQPHDEVYACGPDGELIGRGGIPLSSSPRFTLDRDKVGTLSFPIEMNDLDLDPGVYRVRVSLSTGTGNAEISRGPFDLWLHLAADGDMETARSILRPDGGWATEYNTFADMEELTTNPRFGDDESGPVWDPSGFFLQGHGQGHSGAFGGDPRTRDSDDELLSHGWRIRPGDEVCPFCDDSRGNMVVEWRRSETPSWREGIDPDSWGENDAGDANNRGFGDFGPDRIVWVPHDTRSPSGVPPPHPYMSLASFEDPLLTFQTRYQGTDLTAFVVEMQLPRRGSCDGGGNVLRTCGDWVWDTSWQPLMPEGQFGGPSPGVDDEATRSVPRSGNQPVGTHHRDNPSNPLAGQPGLWGEQSDSHSEDGGWIRLRYPIDLGGIRDEYCMGEIVQGPDFDPQQQNVNERELPESYDPCRYAHAEGMTPGASEETAVSRPVRFRLSAASYGGDMGESFWQVANIALTSHRIDAAGPDKVGFSMSDSDETNIPVRFTNSGTVEDRVQISWRPPPGVAGLQLGETGGVSLSRTIEFEDPRQEIEINLAPGETKTVWVKIETGILGRHPGTLVDVLFLLEARSLIDPTATASVTLDGSFTTRAWPDLETMSLILNDDASDAPFLDSSENVPLQVAAQVRNTGEIPIGGPETPIRVELRKQEIDSQTGAVIEGTRRVIETVELDQPVRPERDGASATMVRFDEWIPPRVGLFRVEVEVNPGGLSALPERSFDLNTFSREVFVGPVRFADLHVTDTWLVEFRDGCRHEPVEHVIAGHTYCVAAEVENRGRQAALEPQIGFGIGAGRPFSTGAPSLQETMRSMFPDNPEGHFPGTGDVPVEVTLRSSPRVLGDRVDGTWNFYAEVSSRSVFPNFDNKTRQLELPVFRFGIDLDNAPDNSTLVPGARTTVALNVTNTGNAAITPVARLEGPDTYRLQSPNLPRIFPGDKAEVKLTIVTSSTAEADDGLPRIFIGSKEDDLIRAPVATRFILEKIEPPRAVPISAQGPPGALNATVAFDNAKGAEPLTWRLLEATSPAMEPTGDWTTLTRPFERNLEEVPLVIEKHTPPGEHVATLKFLAFSNETQWDMEVPWRVQVRSNATLDVEGPTQPFATVAGTPVKVPVRLTNDGNVPIDLRIQHNVDHGSLEPRNETFRLLPGDGTTAVVTVTGSMERILGETAISWTATNGDHGTTNVTWAVRTVESRIQLVESDLQELEPRAGALNAITARIENPGSDSVAVEVLATVDGQIHGRIETTVEAGQQQDVQVPFEAGPADAAQEVILLVRPLGSRLGPDEPGLYDVGDAASANLVPREKSGGIFDMPGPGAFLMMALLGAFFVFVSNRRHAGRRKR